MLHQFVRQCDTTVDRSTGNTARTLHPLRGTAPVTGRYTRYGALHPIRTGVMPTDRVHDPSDNKHKRGVVGKIQPNREHSNRSEGVKPYQSGVTPYQQQA